MYPESIYSQAKPTSTTFLDDPGFYLDEIIGDIIDEIIGIETRVGLPDSLVATTIEYILKNPLSINPGHKHTTASINFGDDENFVTDAQLTIINNISGVNTGDQDLSGYALISSLANYVLIEGGSLTTPKITTSINDANGNEIIETPATASAKNHIKITNAATNNYPVIEAVGDDSNVNLDLKGKGTGTVRKPTSVSIQVVAGGDSIAIGDGQAYITIPEECNGMNLVGAHARVVTAGTTNTTNIQIRNVTDSVDMLSTKLTIDSGETGSDTAATPAVIDPTKDDVVTNDLLAIDIDAISSTAPKGLIIRLRFALP